VFGALISSEFIMEQVNPAGWLFAALALLVARPAALFLVFLGSHLRLAERVAAMWFGPKGFASVVYGLLVLQSGIAHSARLFHLAALVIGLSIVAHSSTDVLMAKKLEEKAASAPPGADLRANEGGDQGR
jgi:NhaP-type Na+/H+ or K+/H+ antiporter